MLESVADDRDLAGLVQSNGSRNGVKSVSKRMCLKLLDFLAFTVQFWVAPHKSFVESRRDYVGLPAYRL